LTDRCSKCVFCEKEESEGEEEFAEKQFLTAAKTQNCKTPDESALHRSFIFGCSLPYDIRRE